MAKTKCVFYATNLSYMDISCAHLNTALMYQRSQLSTAAEQHPQSHGLLLLQDYQLRELVPGPG